MTSRNVLAFVLAAFSSLGACGSSNKGKIVIPKDGSPSTDGPSSGGGDMVTTSSNDGATATGDNTISFIIDSGPSGLPADTSDYNIPFVTVKICASGSTTNCATIDHVSIDTGSTGLRIISSQIPAALLSALPLTKDASSHTVGECYAYADGYVWGSVRTGDFTIGSKTVSSMPFMVIGDSNTDVATVPAQCKQNGESEDTVADFGANGIIGVGTEPLDCGDYCTQTSGMTDPTWPYYSCSAGSCTPGMLADSSQVPNPVSMFASDNNGVMLQTNDPGLTGGANTTGTLVFGIGTQSNNALAGAKVITLDDTGSFTAKLGSATMSSSFLDSGSTDLGFTDTSIAECQDQNYADRYCPASNQALDATITDGTTSADAPFNIGNAETLLGSSNNTAYDNLGYDYGEADTFDFGLPFFMGRKIFTAIDGATTPGGTGPYFAF